MNNVCFYPLLCSLARSVFIAVEVLVLIEAANRINRTRQFIPRSLSHQVTFAIDVDRKVRTVE
jgi:hypothetical protein